MPKEATHEITATHMPGTGKARSMEIAGNAGPWTLVPNAIPMTGKTIKIYSVLPFDFGEINRAAPYSRVHLNVCKDGCKVSEPFVIPPFVRQQKGVMGKFEVTFNYADGREIASDILNPTLGPNWRDPNCQDIKVNNDLWSGGFSNIGNNLNDYGYFWTTIDRDDPALDPLIEKFRARAVITLNRHAQDAVQKETDGAMKSITRLEYFACAYLGVQLRSAAIVQRMSSCPNCGESIKDGIAYHRNQFGICVIDWQRTVAAGVVKKADVPEEMRWFKESEPKK